MLHLMQNKGLSMTDEECRQIYNKLTVAQRRYIFDRKYIPTNPKTQEVLIREGLVIPHNEREQKYGIGGVLKHVTKFTNKCHEMVINYSDRVRKRQSTDYPNHVVINNDEELLDVFSEIAITSEEECDIYVYRGIYGLISTSSCEYILHPYYKWKIEIDRTEGKFLSYKSITGHKGSYSYIYKGK